MAKASKKLDIFPFFLLVLAGLCFFKEVSIDMPHFFLKVYTVSLPKTK